MAERVHHVLGAVPEWRPVSASALPAGGLDGFRCAEEESIHRAGVEARAAAAGLQPVRWPETYPADTAWAMLAATYAASIGRVVAFSLAAFRQAFAAGRDLSDTDNVVLAAAACELHPRAILKGIESRSVKDELRRATEEAIERGVTGVPTVSVGDGLFWGDDRLEEAATAISADGGT